MLSLSRPLLPCSCLPSEEERHDNINHSCSTCLPCAPHSASRNTTAFPGHAIATSCMLKPSQGALRVRSLPLREPRYPPQLSEFVEKFRFLPIAESPNFHNFLRFSSNVGVIQVFSPYGGNSYGLKETKWGLYVSWFFFEKSCSSVSIFSQTIFLLKYKVGDDGGLLNNPLFWTSNCK